MITRNSKSAPFSFQYDESGKPFNRLVSQTGCPLGPTSLACLRKVPFAVREFPKSFSFLIKILNLDIAEYQQYYDQ